MQIEDVCIQILDRRIGQRRMVTACNLSSRPWPIFAYANSSKKLFPQGHWEGSLQLYQYVYTGVYTVQVFTGRNVIVVFFKKITFNELYV